MKGNPLRLAEAGGATAPLPVLGPRAALRSGLACYRRPRVPQSRAEDTSRRSHGPARPRRDPDEQARTSPRCPWTPPARHDRRAIQTVPIPDCAVTNAEAKRKAIENAYEPLTPGTFPDWTHDSSLITWLDSLGH